MAYRKTEKVLAHLDAQRDAILDAAESLIAKYGLGALNMADAASRAGMAAGSVYKYFPDKREVFAALVARALARDVMAMRAAAAGERYPLNALARAIAVFYHGLGEPRLFRAIASEVGYRAGVRSELARLLRLARDDLPPNQIRILAASAFGIICEVFDAFGPSRVGRKGAVETVLRSLGVSITAAERLSV